MSGNKSDVTIGHLCLIILNGDVTVYTFAACLGCNVIHVSSLKYAAGVVGGAYAQLIGDDL